MYLNFFLAGGKLTKKRWSGEGGGNHRSLRLQPQIPHQWGVYPPSADPLVGQDDTCRF